jgi:hypothetical protein
MLVSKKHCLFPLHVLTLLKLDCLLQFLFLPTLERWMCVKKILNLTGEEVSYLKYMVLALWSGKFVVVFTYALLHVKWGNSCFYMSDLICLFYKGILIYYYPSWLNIRELRNVKIWIYSFIHWCSKSTSVLST